MGGSAVPPMFHPKPAEAADVGSGPTLPITHSFFIAVMKQVPVAPQVGVIVDGVEPMYVYA